MPWSVVAIVVAGAASEKRKKDLAEFEKMLAKLPKDEADKLRKERSDAVFKRCEEIRLEEEAAQKIIDDTPPKASKWTMIKYYTAKLALLFFRKWHIVLTLLIFSAAFIALTQQETTNEPENSTLMYEVIK